MHISSHRGSALERLSHKPSRVGSILAGAAAALAAAALYNGYRARKAERDHPPGGRFITVDGVRLHYFEKGEGPPVILLHGNVVTAEDFLISGVFDRVAQNHRVIAFDRPGYGYSERPSGSMWTGAEQAALIRQAFVHLGVERPVLAGHSWGTHVALELALNWPDEVGGLVLLAGYYAVTARLDVPLVAPSGIPVVGDVLRHTVDPLLGSAMLPLNLKAMFAPLPVPDRFKNEFPYGFPVRPSQIRAEAQDAITMVPTAMAMRNRFKDLPMPVTIMAGVKDRIVDPESHAAWLHDQIPSSELRLVPEAGHMFHHAVPDQVAEAITTLSEVRELAGVVDSAPK